MSEDKQSYYKELREQEWRVNLRKQIKASERTNIERVDMPETDPLVRSRSHIEVNQGLTDKIAIREAQRCLDCVNPTCIQGCPVEVNIPTFIKYVEAGDFINAAQTIKVTNSLPAVCGRVCPQEIQCEAKCFYVEKLKKKPIAIGHLERFVADYERDHPSVTTPKKNNSSGIKVAVIGSGPAGLTAAGELIKYGFDVTVFEALHELGGVLKYGIPEFRLPNDVVDFEINNLKKTGVCFIKNFVVGKTSFINELKDEGYEAFFVASGAGLPNFMNIPGENYIGIMSSNEYLTRINLMGAAKPDHDTPIYFGKNVAVIGGGNTAMDSVRTAKRLGAARAMIIYRRSFDEMPARKEEIKHAQEEGIEFLNLNSPVEYIADKNGRVVQTRLQKMELGEPDSSGRRRPVPLEGSEYIVDTDLVIVSVGVSPNPLIPASVKELNVSRWGTIVVNEQSMQSNMEEIFAGGDIVRGGATVILAMGDGRKAAKHMAEYLQSKNTKNKKTSVSSINS